MNHIEIDFDVYKALTARRATENVTHNDVLRELLGLGPSAKKSFGTSTNSGRPWVVSNTSFPPGAELTADYKGKIHTGFVRDGKLELSDGHRFSTPSAAAVYITHNNVNGWRFWRCKLPGQIESVLLERLRGKMHA